MPAWLPNTVRRLWDIEPAAIVDALAGVVRTLSKAANGQPIFGVGIGMASVVDRRREMVRYATYFGWRDLPLAHMLEERLDLPVVLDNDVNALAVAEQWFGAGRGVADFLVVSLGRGVGLGMMLDNRLYRGSGGGAGRVWAYGCADPMVCFAPAASAAAWRR